MSKKPQLKSLGSIKKFNENSLANRIKGYESILAKADDLKKETDLYWDENMDLVTSVSYTGPSGKVIIRKTKYINNYTDALSKFTYLFDCSKDFLKAKESSILEYLSSNYDSEFFVRSKRIHKISYESLKLSGIPDGASKLITRAKDWREFNDLADLRVGSWGAAGNSTFFSIKERYINSWQKVPLVDIEKLERQELEFDVDTREFRFIDNDISGEPIEQLSFELLIPVCEKFNESNTPFTTPFNISSIFYNGTAEAQMAPTGESHINTDNL